MDISIVIPVFEERTKIGRDIQAAAAFLNSSNLTGEIIVVDDGSQDNTSEMAKAVKVSDDVSLRTIRNNEHRGKGHAVRTGVQVTRGNVVMFEDSGNCVPLRYVLTGMEMLRNGSCDIALGSRKLKDSVILHPQPWYRRLLSRLFRWMLILFMKVPAELSDTQCGFKMYRGEVARNLYKNCLTDGFMFDVEIILRAKQDGYKIKEFPIEWSADPDSRLFRTLSLKCMLLELIKIKRTLV